MARIIEVADLPGSETASRFEGLHFGSTASAFLTHHPPGTGPGLHRHPYEETFIVEAGNATFRADGESIDAHGGQGLLSGAGR